VCAKAVGNHAVWPPRSPGAASTARAGTSRVFEPKPCRAPVISIAPKHHRGDGDVVRVGRNGIDHGQVEHGDVAEGVAIRPAEDWSASLASAEQDAATSRFERTERHLKPAGSTPVSAGTPSACASWLGSNARLPLIGCSVTKVGNPASPGWGRPSAVHLPEQQLAPDTSMTTFRWDYLERSLHP